MSTYPHFSDSSTESLSKEMATKLKPDAYIGVV